MHYYSFNIADYRKDTGHLTPVEHHIYRWLIDEYHLSETPIKNDMPKLIRRMGLCSDDRDSLETVLEEFFQPASDNEYKPVDIQCHPEYAQSVEYPELCQYWVHGRIEQGIESYRDFISNKSAAGKASAKARKNKKNSCSTESNSCSTGEQLTNNHKPITNKKDAAAEGIYSGPTLDDVVTFFQESSFTVDPLYFHEFYAQSNWLDAGGNPVKNWKQKALTWDQRERKKNGGAPEAESSTRKRTLQDDLTDTSWAN